MANHVVSFLLLFFAVEVQSNGGERNNHVCQTGEESHCATALIQLRLPKVGGFFTDPNHYVSGTAAGVRMISNMVGNESSDALTLVGSDDGVSFWRLNGTLSGLDCVIDFSPKGGPADLSATFTESALVFADNNSWAKETEFKVATSTSVVSSDIGGVYQDPNHYLKDSLVGTRMISDKRGDVVSNSITLIGSDDDGPFWTLSGHFTSKEDGRIVVDFSPKGGPSDLAGTFAYSQIAWDDGNVWSKMA